MRKYITIFSATGFLIAVILTFEYWHVHRLIRVYIPYKYELFYHTHADRIFESVVWFLFSSKILMLPLIGCHEFHWSVFIFYAIGYIANAAIYGITGVFLWKGFNLNRWYLTGAIGIILLSAIFSLVMY